MVYSPGNTAYKLYQAELLTKLGQPAMAKQIYLNVLQDEPENQTALRNIQLLPTYAAGTACVPGTCIPLPADTPNAQFTSTAGASQIPSAVDAAANQGASPAVNQSTSAAAAGAQAPITGIDPLSSFLRQLRDKVFDQGENQTGGELSASPVADPAGMLHGPGDSFAPPASIRPTGPGL